MITRVIQNYDEYEMIMETADTVRRRRTLARFKNQHPDLYNEFNSRYQMEKDKPDQKPKKGRRKAII